MPPYGFSKPGGTIPPHSPDRARQEQSVPCPVGRAALLSTHPAPLAKGKAAPSGEQRQQASASRYPWPEAQLHYPAYPRPLSRIRPRIQPMPARFVVGPPQRLLPKARQRHAAHKRQQSAFLRIPSQERSYAIQHTRLIVKDKATHPVHARVLQGQGRAVLCTSGAQETFAKGMARDSTSPARLSPGAVPCRQLRSQRPLLGTWPRCPTQNPLLQAQTASKVRPREHNDLRDLTQAARFWNFTAVSARQTPACRIPPG